MLSLSALCESGRLVFHQDEAAKGVPLTVSTYKKRRLNAGRRFLLFHSALRCCERDDQILGRDAGRVHDNGAEFTVDQDTDLVQRGVKFGGHHG